MKRFSFPPPPPPPPRATSQDGNPGANAPPGGHGYRSARGGADRGRGRGRGRGSNNRGGHSGSRNNHASLMGGFQPQNHRNGHALPSDAQQHQTQTLQSNGPPANFNSLPCGGFINPAFASAYSNYVNTNPPTSFWNPATAQQLPQNFPLNTNAIANNLKNNSVGSHQGSNRPPPQPKPKPNSKPKVAAPPVVPSFGFQLPAAKPEAHAQAPSNNSKKRKFNQLGLTPRGDVREDSEEDDADEEAKFTTGVLQFEYKGRSSTLKTRADIAAWIAERKKQYPTKARALEKQKEEEEMRKAREEKRRNAEASAERENKHKAREAPANKRKSESDDRNAMEKHLAKAEKLRKKLEKAEAKINGATPAPKDTHPKSPVKAVAVSETKNAAPANSYKTDLVGYDTDDDEQSSDAKSSVVSSDSSDLSNDTDSDTSSGDGSDSDAPPEEESSAKRPIRVAPPGRKPLAPQPKHKTKKEAKRLTLRERMIEQEQQREAEMALEAIKFLGDQGMLG